MIIVQGCSFKNDFNPLCQEQMDSDMEWIRPRPKMTEKQWNVYRRPISLVLNIGLIVKHYTTQCDKCIQKIVNAAEQLLYSQCFFSWPLVGPRRNIDEVADWTFYLLTSLI